MTRPRSDVPVTTIVKQAIAGVAPPELSEVTTMTVWPSIASTGLGRALGSLYGIRAGVWILTIGRLFMLFTLPLALLLYFAIRMPWAIRRYRLTNRRVMVERGLRPTVERFVDLDRFDTIEVVVLPGQAAYHAGDLVFRKGNVETFRLSGVSRPEPFRQTCLKAQVSYVEVRKILKQQAG
jgi:hypothetical protein